MAKPDPNDGRPSYLQVADLIKKAIRDGEYAPGDQLPALGALATQFDVAVGTVRSAVNLLQDNEVLVIRHGRGTFVHSDLNVDDLAVPLSHNQSGDNGEVLRLLREISDQLADIQRRLPVQ
ncbi:GntR family transcriptional regulator [Lentzea cavernae]|nr:winged helix-turn-helix domain-containing protein [Lentzea cavernae]